MQRFLRNLPIRRKLVFITMLTSGIALVVACLALATCEQVTSRKRILQNISVLAEMAGANSAVGLKLNEPGWVEQALQSLSAQSSIVRACVYDRQGRPFARYQRAGVQGDFSSPPVLNNGPRLVVVGDQLEFFQEIKLAGERIGTVYLCADLSDTTARIWGYLLIVCAVLSSSALIAFFLSQRLQKVISEPLTDLAKTVTRVAKERNYSMRALKQGDDELGHLIDGFNHILAQIQEREEALQAARENLERRVEERTRELGRSLSALAYERDLLNTLLDNIPDAIYFKDRHCRFMRVSRSKLKKSFDIVLSRHRASHSHEGPGSLPPHLGSLDAFAEYLVGKSDFDFLQEESARSTHDAEQEIMRTGKPLLGNIERSVQLDGEVRWSLSTKMPWRDKDGNIIGTFGTSKDITPIKDAEAKLEEVHRQLLDTSRQAGMAEVASSVLHNVGNVLNSVNTSASVVTDLVRASTMSGVAKVAALLEENRGDLAGFLAREDRAATVINYLKALSEHLGTEQARVLRELQELTKNIDHIKEIVAMQQSYAKVSGVVEFHSLPALVEDALRMHLTSLSHHDVHVIRNFDPVPDVLVDKHKILQILVNLISNAKYALSDSNAAERCLTLGVSMDPDNRVRVSVADNGIGIASDNLTRIFNHGFTTKKDGHGFGLHSGAIAAREMGGALLVRSDGLGKGATFTLELPARLKDPPAGSLTDRR